MSSKNYDVIIAGAGSIGTPTAMYLAQAGLSVLVIEALASPGQASNKHAIGGSGDHSDHSKIYLCARSIEVFSTWKGFMVMISTGARVNMVCHF